MQQSRSQTRVGDRFLLTQTYDDILIVRDEPGVIMVTGEGSSADYLFIAQNVNFTGYRRGRQHVPLRPHLLDQLQRS
jgi:hypothetical protein